MIDWRYELYAVGDGWAIHRWDGERWTAINYPPIKEYAEALVLIERLRLQAASQAVA